MKFDTFQSRFNRHTIPLAEGAGGAASREGISSAGEARPNLGTSFMRVFLTKKVKEEVRTNNLLPLTSSVLNSFMPKNDKNDLRKSALVGNKS